MKNTNQIVRNLGYNPGEIGAYMRKMVQGAIKIIRVESKTPVFEDKIGYSGFLDDVVGRADKMAQVYYRGNIDEMFPGFGIIGEEENLKQPCTIDGHDIYFTLDPVDGTKAFKRQQSHGVGTMIALVVDGEVIAAYIGDVNTGEIFGFDDTIDKAGIVKRFRFDYVVDMQPNLTDKLADQYIYTRRHPLRELGVVQRLIKPRDLDGLFKDIEISGGSIGCAMARLWKGEVGAVVLDPAHITPWDETPVMAITQRMGFIMYDVTENTVKRGKFAPPQKEVTKNPSSHLVVHREHENELMAWLN